MYVFKFYKDEYFRCRLIDFSELPIDVTKHIVKFREFLNISWPYLDDIMEFHDWEDDGQFTCEWIQSCWQFLVQRELLGNNDKTLTPFGICPLLNVGFYPTYTVHVIPKKGNTLFDPVENKEITNFDDLRLLCFLKKLDIGSGLYPPFDLVSVYDERNKKIREVYFEEVGFVLCKYWRI